MTEKKVEKKLEKKAEKDWIKASKEGTEMHRRNQFLANREAMKEASTSRWSGMSFPTEEEARRRFENDPFIPKKK